MKERLYKALKSVALFSIVSSFILLSSVFYTAFFSDYTVLITINQFGEAQIEAYAVIPILLSFNVFLIYDYFKEVYKK